MKPERHIRNVALRLLSRREHSRLELDRKLKTKGFLSDEIDELLDSLANEGLQSDARYAENYIRSRRQRGFGPLKIRLELQRRGISSDLMDSLINDDHIDADHQTWLDIARREYAKKFGDQTAESMQEKARRARFLQARGFTGDIIRETLTPAR